MDVSFQEDLKKAYRKTAIFGALMIASVFSYAVIVEVLKANSYSTGAAMTHAELSLWRYAFLGITVVDFFFIVFMNRSVRSRAEKEHLSITDHIEKLKTAAFFSTFPLCEGIAVSGMILFLLGHNTADFYLFMVLSLFFFAVHFPRYSRWEEWLTERVRAQSITGVVKK